MKLLAQFISGLALVVSIVAFDESSSSPPVGSIAQGKLRGKFLESAVSKRKYAAFLSIPYAKPPVGENRFKEAVPAGPWPGVFDATREAPLCVQQNFFVPLRSPAVSGSEDCLYLNVYTPNLSLGSDKSKLLDVIVYIHGGAFMAHGSSELVTNRILDRDVVLVTINYRLGPFGFLSTQDSVLPGNLGMKDQVLALKWVQNNIAAFGGDANKVTIAGMSAGAASVHYHTLSPLSKGLFHRGIAESGAATNSWAYAEDPVQNAHALARLMGCPTDNSRDLVDCLRQRPADHLAAAGLDVMNWHVSTHIPFTPAIEPASPTAFLTKHPLEIIANNEALDVPLLFSFSQHEGLLMVAGIISDSATLEAVNSNWNAIGPNLFDYNRTVSEDRKEAVGTEMKRKYFGNKNFKDDIGQLVKLASDRLFVSGIEEGVKLQAAHSKSPIYLHEFGYKGTVRSSDKVLSKDIFNGVGHAENAVYVVPLKGMLDDVHKDDEPMSIELINIWMNFITDSPMPKGWKTVQEGLPKLNLMKVTKPNWNENHMETHDDYSNLKFWNSLDLDGNSRYQKFHSDEL